MAHSSLQKEEVRDLFVNSLLSTTVIALQTGVPEGTIRRWKLSAKKAGDCWDSARQAARMTKGPMGELTNDFLEKYQLEVNKVFETLKQQDELDESTIGNHMKYLNSLVESMRKIRVIIGDDKKLPKRAIAAKIIQFLLEFIRREHPEELATFQPILAQFGTAVNQGINDGSI